MKLAIAALILAPVLFSVRVPFAGNTRSRCSAFIASAAAKDFAVSDDALYDAVRRRLADDPDVKGGAIRVDVKDGNVTLSGKVNNERARQKAAKLAKKVKGVRSVNNQLTAER